MNELKKYVINQNPWLMFSKKPNHLADKMNEHFQAFKVNYSMNTYLFDVLSLQFLTISSTRVRILNDAMLTTPTISCSESTSELEDHVDGAAGLHVVAGNG